MDYGLWIQRLKIQKICCSEKKVDGLQIMDYG